MVKNVLSAALLAVLCMSGSMVAAQSLFDNLTPACNGEPAMYRYTLPRDETGAIVFRRTYDIEKGEAIDTERVMEPVGAPICLSADSATVHVLDVGYGPGIELPNPVAVTAAVESLEIEARAEATRVLKAHGIKPGM